MERWFLQFFANMKKFFETRLMVSKARSFAAKQSRNDESNTSKSKRVMRMERGHQKELVGIRRFDRYLRRVQKRRASYGNNV